MAVLTPQSVKITGTQATYTAASASDTFRFKKNAVLHVKNGGGSSITVTVVVPGETRGVANADVTVSVTNGTEKFIGPFDQGLLGSSGYINVTYSGTTSVTHALLLV